MLPRRGPGRAVFLAGVIAAGGLAGPADSAERAASARGSQAGTTSPEATLAGAVVSSVPLYLSPDALVAVRLLDISRADAPATKLSEVEFAPKDEPPFPFQLPYSPAAIVPSRTYVVAAEIREHGALLYRSQGVRVLTRGGTTFSVDVSVEPVQGPLTAAATEEVDARTAGSTPGGAGAENAPANPTAPGPVLGAGTPVPEDALAGLVEAGWARELPGLRRAIDTCAAHRPSQAFRVRAAWRTEGGGASVRLGGAQDARFDCTASPDGTRVVGWRRLAGDAAAARGEGEVVFTPQGGHPPSGPCYRHRQVVSGGVPAGWLSLKQC
jgi:putative lipoprotein